MLAVLCPTADGAPRRRLVDVRDVIAMTRTDTEVVLTVACPCGGFHEHRVPRSVRTAPASGVLPSVAATC